MQEKLDRLTNCDLFAGLRRDEVEEIVGLCRQMTVASGQTVCGQGEDGQSMFIILAGRVRVSVDRGGGGQTILNYLGEGNHFGELAMLIGGPRTATVTAVIDVELLELTRSVFQRLMVTLPGFAANLSRTLGVWLRGEISGRRRCEQAVMVAVVRTSPLALDLARQLVESLAGKGESVCVLSDRPHDWTASDRKRVLALRPTHDTTVRRAVIKQALATAARQEGRVLVDVGCDPPDPALLMQCELVWWPLRSAADADERLTQLLTGQPRLRGRIQRLWLHRIGQPLAPPHSADLPTIQPEPRVAWTEVGSRKVRFRPPDLARLVHRLQGIHLGLALGGGGARGVAHVGVLRAFEKEGIYFDRIAGTSAGALLGTFYAAGYPVEAMLEMVEQELTPPAWMRFVPKGGRAYLLAMYRMGLASRKLRRYLCDYVFEQLLVPTHTVSVDLVSGTARVRESGDVVAAILESINLPVVSAPILRDGDALVDGGVLINVPASVLRQRDANFVVAVDVGSKLAPSFGGNTPSTPAAEMRRPGLLETIVRVTEVQQQGLASIHASESDFLITPDTSPFRFDEFARARQLAEVGQAAAEKAIPQLKQLLADTAGSTGNDRRQVA